MTQDVDTTPTRRTGTSRSRRRQEILEMAERVFASKGYVASSVRDIAEEAGILSGSLYHHFTSKDDMLVELLDTYLTDLQERYSQAAAQDDGLQALQQMIRVGYESIAEHSDIASILHNDFSYLRTNSSFAFVQQHYLDIRGMWLDVIDRGQTSGALRDDLDVYATYRVIMGAIFSASRWLTPGRKFDVEALISTASAIYLEGLVARP